MGMKMITVIALTIMVLFGLVGCEGTDRELPARGGLLTPAEREDILKKVETFLEPIDKLEKAEKYRKDRRFEEAEQLYLSVIDTRPSQPLFTTRAYVGLTEVYVEMGKPKEAEAAAEKAVELGGLVSGEYWALGECYEKLGNLIKAEEAFLKAVKLQPEGTLYSLLGQFYANHGQHLKAEAAYRRGLELEPTNGSFHLLLASYYLRIKRHTDAITCYENAIKYTDSNKVKAEILNNIGTIYKSMYKFKKSAEAFEKALSLATDPDNIGMICRNMAWLAMWPTVSSDVNEALRLCDIALKNDPQNVVALRSKAYALSHREKYVDAHKLLDQALKIRSGECETFIILAHVYLDEGQANKALRAAKRAVHLSQGEYPWSQSTLGEVYVRTGQHKKAVELLAPLVKGDSTFADLDYWYGQALADSGQEEEGLKFVKRAASKLPFVVEYKQGLQALQKQQPVPSGRKLVTPQERKIVGVPDRRTEPEVVRETFPAESVESAFELGRKLSKAKQYKKMRVFKEAEELYLSIIKTQPSLSYAYVELAEVYVEWGKPKKAEDALTKVFEVGGLQWPHYLIIAKCYEKLGKPKEAEQAYLKLVQLRPVAQHYSLLGQFYRNQGQDDKTIEAYKRALELEPTRRISISQLAGCYHDMGRYDEAIEKYKQAIEHADSNEDKVMLLLNLGRAHGDKGEREKSIEIYQRALSLAIIPKHVHMVCTNISGQAMDLIDSEEIGEALRLCHIALAKDPQNVQALRNKAYALSGIKKCKEAHKLLDQALRLRPDDVISLIVRTHVYLEEGKESKALAEAKHGVDISKGSNLWCQSTLGEVYVRSGQYKEAIELLGPLVDKSADHGEDYSVADLCYWYGQALANSGQQKEGLKFIEKAVSISPNVVEYKQGLEALQKQ